MTKKFLFLLFFAIVFKSGLFSEKILAQYTIALDYDIPQLRFAVDELDDVLRSIEETLVIQSITNTSLNPDLLIVIAENQEDKTISDFTVNYDPSIQEEGYKIFEHSRRFKVVLAKDAAGAMYGLLDIAEQIKNQKAIEPLPDKLVNPHQKVRAIKFNLPWSPYQGGEKMELHKPTVKDLDFWEEFLNMMAKNRFNTLSLWNLHPFPYMIRAKNFPEATPFSDQELKEWKVFWKSLFKMAHDRSIETYVLNWNIKVSDGMANAYNVQKNNDTSEIVKKYTRESVTQIINEYENLDGLGVCLCDNMRNMTPVEKENWLYETFIQGIKNADRPVKFIHRSVHAESASAMRELIDRANLPDPVKVTVKFNWSHGHSTPKFASSQFDNTGQIDEGFWKPHPTNYNIQWTIRNEDFFILRWGDPDFVRKHIYNNNYDYTSGYFIGSEGYIPAKDFMQKYSPFQTWQYSFQRQWMFYKVWGRLLFDPETPDEVFINAMKNKFNLEDEDGQIMFNVYQRASQVPLRIASFHQGTYDLSLYSEGFLAPYPNALNYGSDRPDQPIFIGINQFIDQKTLNPEFISIHDFVNKNLNGETIPENKVTPVELAQKSENDSRQVLEQINSLREKVNVYSSGSLPLELDDMESWGYLGLYFADKIRAGVALETFYQTGNNAYKQEAVRFLETCLEHWEKVVDITDKNYREIPYVRQASSPGPKGNFSWKLYLPEVKRDIDMAKEAAED